MKVIDKYIFKLCNQAIVTVIACLLTLTSLFALFEELNESDVTYGFWEATNYILATTPYRTQELLIYSVFLGVLIFLGRLAESNELTILRTSGWSPLQLLVALLCRAAAESTEHLAPQEKLPKQKLWFSP